jgi:hypothetical protein
MSEEVKEETPWDQRLREHGLATEVLHGQKLEFEEVRRHRAALEDSWRIRAGVDERIATAWERMAYALESLAAVYGRPR